MSRFRRKANSRSPRYLTDAERQELLELLGDLSRTMSQDESPFDLVAVVEPAAAAGEEVMALEDLASWVEETEAPLTVSQYEFLSRLADVYAVQGEISALRRFVREPGRE